MTGIALYVLFAIVSVYLGSESLPVWVQVFLYGAGAIVCDRVGGHVERS